MSDLLPDELPQSGVAVIGMACRVPGASSLDELWENLCAGRESITRFSREELLAAGNDPALVEHPEYVPMNRVAPGADTFDAGLFGLTPREAELLDPQQRLFLECAHEALEAAGYGAREHRGRVGVYAGTTTSTYLLHNLLPSAALLRAQGLYQLFLHNEKDFLPTRASYKLDLRGPSVNVQTACSTSLVAIHLACQALLESECELALAGGASVRVPQASGYLYQKDMIFSPDGRSRAFDAEARGTVAGSGAGVVVLKLLSAALEDGDPILAVIRGSAINNDGAAKVGYTAPSVEGQAHVIAEAMAVAGVSPDSITYVEAHGTGTPLGDPIEIAALTRAFRAGTQRRGYCALGALKSNVGHLDAAAGVGGLIKAVLMLRHRTIVPCAGFSAPNPQIDFSSSPFHVPTALSPWRAGGAPLRAGVSAFGIGGTNAHVVLEEAPSTPPPGPATPRDPLQLLTLSARSPAALVAASRRLADHLERNGTDSLADVAYSLHVGREPHPYRRALVCRGPEDAIRALRRDEPAPAPAQPSSAVFLFPGGGAQYPHMAEGLYQAYPVFREALDAAVQALRAHTDIDVRALLFADADPDQHARRLQRPLGGLVCLFAVEVALARLLLSWGIEPQGMVGHSMGEYTAAHLAGVFTLEDAAALIARRGQLFEALPSGGAMLSVPLGEAELGPELGEGLAIAAVSTPSVCTVSGASAEIERLAARLEARGITCRRILIDVAAHSAAVDPILEPFRGLLRRLTLRPPAIPILSNLTGTWLTDAQATDPEYWVQHLRRTVRFSDALTTLLDDRARVLLEVGPGNTLVSLARQHPAYRGQAALSALRHPRTEVQDAEFLLAGLGALWSSGGPVRWPAFHAHERRRRVSLPTYPFERQRYWIDPPAPGERAPAPEARPRAELSNWFYVPGWKQSTPAAGEAEEPSRFALLADDSGLCDALSAHLSRLGHEVTLVRRGSGFARTAAGEFTIDPARPGDYQALLEALGERAWSGPGRTHVVHAFSVCPAGGAAPVTPGSVAEALSLGLHGLLHLVRALDRAGASPRVTALVSDLHGITGDEALRPEKATIAGWLRTMPFEYPGVACRVVDVTLPARGAEVEALAARLGHELAGGADEPLVAYRGRQRWIPTAEPLRLAARAAGSAPRLLRERGVYLITGGLGGVGLSLAGALAGRVQARLVLTSRGGLPPRDQWERLLAEGDTDAALRERIHRVRALERLGAEVMTVAADVASRPAMERAVAEARARFGAIHGVIHAAGVPGGGAMLRQTPASIAATLAPKVEGALVLDAIFADAALDFMVLCSALVTLVGAFGHLDYTAANAFLDAFAHQRVARGRRVISIDWNRWRSLGMSVAVEAQHRALTGEALTGMTEEEGRTVFLRILESEALTLSALPQVAISSEDLGPLLRAHATPRAQAGAGPEAAPDRPRTASHRRPQVSTAYRPAADAAEARLIALLEDLLGIEGIGADDDFFELGGNSLMGTRLVAHASEAFAEKLSLRDVFEAPTAAGLARRIEAARLRRALLSAPASPSGSPDELEEGRL